MNAHEQLHRAHGLLENLHGPEAVLGAATLHHEQVRAWYSTLSSAADRRSVGALLAETGGFMGWISFDRGHFGEAVQRFRESASLAAQANDISQCVNNMGQASRALGELGYREDALTLVNAAIHAGGTRAHPAVRTWLYAVRSFHRARLGDSASALSDLTTANNLLGFVEDGEIPTYIGYLDHAEISKWTAHTLTQLARTSPILVGAANQAADDTRRAWRPAMARGYAEVLTASARSRLLAGDMDEAAAYMRQANQRARATNSIRNLRAARRIRDGLPA